MGQSSSSPLLPTHQKPTKTKPLHTQTCKPIDTHTQKPIHTDFTSFLPDELLSLILNPLSSLDRTSCSLVCRRWYTIEAQTRSRLSLSAKQEIIPNLHSIFKRFDCVTKLALRCDRMSISIDDGAIIEITGYCKNITRLKIRGCREVTDFGIIGLANNCKLLKKFSCGSCDFGVSGMNALLEHCALENLTIKRLRGIKASDEPVKPGVAALSLRSICLKEIYNGQCFAPLIVGAKNLKTFKLLRCLGDWNDILERMSILENSLVEIHLERVQVNDTGIIAISNCLNLEVFHLVKTPDCTNIGIVSVAEHCKLLRKLHIDGWRTNRIGNVGLTAIAKNSTNLQELVLIGVNPNAETLDAIATGCQKLERLALCGSETIGDSEISCVAAKCGALKKLCIKGCRVSDQGIKAFGWGCPNLVKMKVKKCKGVTGKVADWLKVRRESLELNIDVCELEAVVLDASGSDGGTQEDYVEFPPMATLDNTAADIPSTSSSRSVFRPMFGLFGGRSFWANGFGSCSNNGSNVGI